MRKRTKKRNGLREIPDDLWQLIEPILPPDKPPGTNGRSRVPNRSVLNGILYILRTGCQWKMVPPPIQFWQYLSFALPKLGCGKAFLNEFGGCASRITMTSKASIGGSNRWTASRFQHP